MPYITGATTGAGYESSAVLNFVPAAHHQRGAQLVSARPERGGSALSLYHMMTYHIV